MMRTTGHTSNAVQPCSEHGQRMCPEPFGPGEGLRQVIVHAATLPPVDARTAQKTPLNEPPSSRMFCPLM